MTHQQNKKILLISLNRLGDNLQVTPILQVLRENNPAAAIWVLTEKGFDVVFNDNPYIDKIELFDRRNYKGEHFTSVQILQSNLDPVLEKIRNQYFDLIINRQSSREGAIIAGVIPAKEKRGYIALENGQFTIPDVWTRLLFAMSAERRHNPFSLVEYNVRIAGNTPNSITPYIHYDINSIKNFLKELNLADNHKIIVIQPGASTIFRQWDANNFIRLIQLLLKNNKNLKIVLLAGPEEKKLAEHIALNTGEVGTGRLFQSWHLTIKDIAALLSQSKLMITNDTGPMHVAEAVGCKVLCLYFGGSLINETAPYGQGNLVMQADLDCIPCSNYNDCPREYACKPVIKPENVAEIAAWMIENNKNIDPELLPDNVRVLYSVKTGKRIEYFPLFKPSLDTDSFIRTLYYITFLRYIDRQDINIDLITANIEKHYSNAGEIINGAIDINPVAINRFSQSDEESNQLKQILLNSLEEIRSSYTAFVK